MILKELVLDLDKIFHKQLALEWDRAGLQVGNGSLQVSKVLVTLDVDDRVIDEAISSGTSIIISHHPAVFEDPGDITDSTVIGSRILRLAENRIAAYAAHTNYDIMEGGLNDLIAQKLGLEDTGAIVSEYGNWYKFVVFIPKGSQEEVRKALCGAGGGKLGDYSCCTFSSGGTGTFLPGKDARPHTGKPGILSQVDELRMECMVSEQDLEDLVYAALKAHPYEQPAYDIYRLENRIDHRGPGRTGRLKHPAVLEQYIGTLKKELDAGEIGIFDRERENAGSRMIEKVALVAGSCNSLTGELAALDCDMVITGEISYHNAARLWDSGKIVASLGHGTIEKHAIEGICSLLEAYIDKRQLDIEVKKTRSGYWDWRYDIGSR
jgi:dinuclear metal center YbgI/SA1388 family protein